MMTAEELAQYLSFSRNWIYRKAEAGEIPGQKSRNRWQFRKSAIDQWLEQQIGDWKAVLRENSKGMSRQ